MADTTTTSSRYAAIKAGAEAAHRPYCQAGSRNDCSGAEVRDVEVAEAALDAAHGAGHIVWAEDVARCRAIIQASVEALNDLLALRSVGNSEAELLCRIRDHLGGANACL
jgi:hypothetical protein